MDHLLCWICLSYFMGTRWGKCPPVLLSIRAVKEQLGFLALRNYCGIMILLTSSGEFILSQIWQYLCTDSGQRRAGRDGNFSPLVWKVTNSCTSLKDCQTEEEFEIFGSLFSRQIQIRGGGFYFATFKTQGAMAGVKMKHFSTQTVL